MKTNLFAAVLLVTVVFLAVETVSDADDTAVETTPTAQAASVDDKTPEKPLLEVPIANFPSAGAALPATEVQANSPSDPVRDEARKEQIWTEITEAISGLNRLVGDELFRGLERKSASEMQVLVDPGYWSRVRYETRVELKTDISKIWHLYAVQYNATPASSVFFVDADSGKTIDIYTQAAQ
jgi:hypothetical protein